MNERHFMTKDAAAPSMFDRLSENKVNLKVWMPPVIKRRIEDIADGAGISASKFAASALAKVAFPELMSNAERDFRSKYGEIVEAYDRNFVGADNELALRKTAATIRDMGLLSDADEDAIRTIVKAAVVVLNQEQRQ